EGDTDAVKRDPVGGVADVLQGAVGSDVEAPGRHVTRPLHCNGEVAGDGGAECRGDGGDRGAGGDLGAGVPLDAAPEGNELSDLDCGAWRAAIGLVPGGEGEVGPGKAGPQGAPCGGGADGERAWRVEPRDHA